MGKGSDNNLEALENMLLLFCDDKIAIIYNFKKTIKDILS